ncbi:MAG: thioredoxin domain-containing protein [Proteobacteria bacterium]|nr:thioredoxin domain-containing protein [Pseudomonadota bacterium]
MTRNYLAEETSPYLLQHKDNPVHWRPWGEAALDAARDSGKPILLSVGYAACHWCHVMAHESFEDETIAGIMNDLFINIKVDREERPDIDVIYQAALQMLGEQGGWPLTIFLNDAGEPFWGGTYFPPTPRFGRPAFTDVLKGIAGVYRDDPERVRNNATALTEGLKRLGQSESGGDIPAARVNMIAERLVREIDPVHGGIGGAPKFPQPSFLEQLWRAYKRTGQKTYADAVLLSVTQMCQGGIYDHLRGGLARYSTDERWLAPHFEKMLYDNAQLVDLLALLWQETRNPLYAQRVAETIDWVLGDMTDAEGAFYSSLDADSEGEEGKFCVWSEAEIDTALGPDATLFKKYYNVSAGGNWEGHNILNRLHNIEPADDEIEDILATCRRTLLAIREARIQPGKDDKVLADWNGLMIAALVNAGAAFGRQDWIDAGARAFAFVHDRMTLDGRLRHAWRAGKLNHPATLDDYAAMCRAALALFEICGDPAYRAAATAWLDIVERHYADTTGGGYFLAADDTPGLITRTKSAADNAVPSGNGMLTAVFARLYYLTGDKTYLDRAQGIVAAFSGELDRNVFPLSTLLNANDLMRNAVQIVIAGAPDAEDTQALRRAVTDVCLPNRILTVLPPNTELPATHPAHGKGQKAGTATAYVCQGMICSPPLTDAGDLRTDLATR